MSTQHYAIEMFYDGHCPLCTREAKLISAKDKHGRIIMTDIAAPTFDADAYGRSLATFNHHIQGRLPDGSWVTGVEVFRVVYAAIGFRWLVAPTRWWGIRHVLDVAYNLFAKNRYRLTGRCTPESCELPT